MRAGTKCNASGLLLVNLLLIQLNFESNDAPRGSTPCTPIFQGFSEAITAATGMLIVTTACGQIAFQQAVLHRWNTSMAI